MSAYVVRRVTRPAQQSEPELSLSGELLREVSAVQHDKTLLAVRDAVEKIPVKKKSSGSYYDADRSAEDFRKDVLAILRDLGGNR